MQEFYAQQKIQIANLQRSQTGNKYSFHSHILIFGLVPDLIKLIQYQEEENLYDDEYQYGSNKLTQIQKKLPSMILKAYLNSKTLSVL